MKSHYLVRQSDMAHLVQATSERARLLVIHAPPYEENPARAVRHG